MIATPKQIKARLAQRKRLERKRKRDQGLIQVQLWVREKHRDTLINFVERLNKNV